MEPGYWQRWVICKCDVEANNGKLLSYIGTNGYLGETILL